VRGRRRSVRHVLRQLRLSDGPFVHRCDGAPNAARRQDDTLFTNSWAAAQRRCDDYAARFAAGNKAALRSGDRPMPIRFTSACLAAATMAAASALSDPAAAQLLQRKDLSYAVARAMAEAALESCHAKGYTVSVVVVDRAGETLIALRGDNAPPHTMENARRKAYTARSFQRSTAEYAKQLESGNPVIRQQVTLPHVIAIPGGLPIKVGADTIGGIGLSGSPGVDEPCVQAGIDTVADQLK
jgi:uncharacterized protein GlcG (DUF336 family)